MKKTVSVLLAGVMALSLAACSKPAAPAATTAEAAPAATTTAAAPAETKAAETPAETKAELKWPEHTITIQAGQAGGNADWGARYLAEWMHNEFGVNTIVQNNDSAMLTIREVSSADPDGYTFYYGNISSIISEVAGVSDINILEDCDVVCRLQATGGTVIAVKKDLGVNNLKELFELAESKPDELVISTKLATNTDVVVRMLMDAGLKVTPADTGSTSTRVTAFLGDTTQIYAGEYSGIEQYIKTGEVIPLAVTMPERQKAFPDIPTAKESGYDISCMVTYFVAAPKGTPKEIVDKVSEFCAKMSEDSEYQQKIFETQGWSPAYLPTDEAYAALNAQRQSFIDLGMGNN